MGASALSKNIHTCVHMCVYMHIYEYIYSNLSRTELIYTNMLYVGSVAGGDGVQRDRPPLYGKDV
jgi:hypothetical protein